MTILNTGFFRTAENPAGRRGVLQGRLCLLALPLAAVLGACAGNPHQTARSSEYYLDAQLCRTQNPLKPRVRTNLGGNLSAEIVAGVDTANYLKCMDRLGWQQDARTDPLLKALEKCRRKAEQPMQATPQSGGTRLSSGLDRAVFQKCLRDRGFEGEVTVEPLRPAEPQRP